MERSASHASRSVLTSDFAIGNRRTFRISRGQTRNENTIPKRRREGRKIGRESLGPPFDPFMPVHLGVRHHIGNYSNNTDLTAYSLLSLTFEPSGGIEGDGKKVRSRPGICMAICHDSNSLA